MRRDEMMPVQNLGSLCSDRTPRVLGLVTHHFSSPRGLEKRYFLQNEPNFSQCLPHFLKKFKANQTHFKAKKSQFEPN
jgi:hypothetical protein